MCRQECSLKEQKKVEYQTLMLARIFNSNSDGLYLFWMKPTVISENVKVLLR